MGNKLHVTATTIRIFDSQYTKIETKIIKKNRHLKTVYRKIIDWQNEYILALFPNTHLKPNWNEYIY